LPQVTPASLRGCILEEVLAYLVRSSGYSLLSSPKQDPEALGWRRNGLVVKGRGSEHQVDVLGELDWTPAFTFPLRLFLEAKFHEDPVGIVDIRNAVGVLSDLNQRYLPSVSGPLIRRFRYAYALFSVSGFTRPASDMAFAHEVSLVDLSDPIYQPLRDAVVTASEALARIPKHRTTPEDNAPGGDPEDQPFLVRRTRYALRTMLGTDPQVDDEPLETDPSIARRLEPVVESTIELRNLFVGMAAGPFMLLIHAKGREAFIQRMIRSPALTVTIGWSPSIEGGRRWVIRPVESGQTFELSFTVPQTIGDWIFSDETSALTRARRFKSAVLPHIFIPYRDDDGLDHLFRPDYTEIPRS
jgi:hypothetical protein